MSHGRLVDHEIANAHATGRVGDVCDDTRAVLRFIARKKWKLLHCQYRVENAETLTYADMICIDAEGVIVILELKTSLKSMDAYRELYRKADPRHPLMADGTPNSPYWRHQKQLWGTMWLWNKQEGKNHKMKGFVLVVCQGRVASIPLKRTPEK